MRKAIAWVVLLGFFFASANATWTNFTVYDFINSTGQGINTSIGFDYFRSANGGAYSFCTWSSDHWACGADHTIYKQNAGNKTVQLLASGATSGADITWSSWGRGTVYVSFNSPGCIMAGANPCTSGSRALRVDKTNNLTDSVVTNYYSITTNQTGLVNLTIPVNYGDVIDVQAQGDGSWELENLTMQGELDTDGLFAQAWDELITGNQKTFNLTVANTTNQTLFQVNYLQQFNQSWANLPTGNVTLTFRNASCLSTGVLPRTYYYNTAFGKLNLTAYFLCDSDGSSPVAQPFVVKDYLNNLLSNAVICAERFIGTQYYNTTCGTSADGALTMYLDATQTAGYLMNGVYTGYPLLTKTVVASTTSVNIIFGSSNYPVFTQSQSVTANCTFDNTTNTLSCMVNDSSKFAASARLVVKQMSGTGWLDTCDTTVSGSNASLSCINSNLSKSLFGWYIELTNSDGSTFLAESGTFDYRSVVIAWGSSAYVFVLLLFVALCAIGSWNPPTLIFMGGLALIFAYLLGAFNVGWAGIVSVVLLVALLVWKTRA